MLKVLWQMVVIIINIHEKVLNTKLYDVWPSHCGHYLIIISSFSLPHDDDNDSDDDDKLLSFNLAKIYYDLIECISPCFA
jgi:hypothetical protein